MVRRRVAEVGTTDYDRGMRTPMNTNATLVALSLAIFTSAPIAHASQRINPYADRASLCRLTIRDYLAERAALVREGKLAEARLLWAKRSLVAEPPGAGDTLLDHRSRVLAAAAERFANAAGDGFAYYRLARSLTDARWYAEARWAAAEAVRRAPELDGASELATLLARLEGAVAALDSAATQVHAQARWGVAPPQALPVFMRDLIDARGWTVEGLLQRHIYVGRRAAPPPAALWDAVWAVVVQVDGVHTLDYAEASVGVRRVVYDDNRCRTLAPGGAADAWTPEPAALGERGTVVVYHNLDPYRQSGIELYEGLARLGGAPPADLGHDKFREEGRRQLVALLRQQAAAPLYQALAADANPDERLRRFVLESASLRMRLAEIRLARQLLDAEFYEGVWGAGRLGERQRLEAVRLGPWPRWEIADWVAEAAPASTSPDAVTARALLGFLQKSLQLNGLEALPAVSDSALRQAALAVSIDRFSSD